MTLFPQLPDPDEDDDDLWLPPFPGDEQEETTLFSSLRNPTPRVPSPGPEVPRVTRLELARLLRASWERNEPFDLRGVQLAGDLWQRANLSGLDMGGVHGAEFDFCYATMQRVRFVEAVLDGAQFACCVMPACLFESARCLYTNFLRANVEGSDFRYANLSYAVLADTYGRGSTFHGATCTRMTAASARLPFCDFEEAKLHEASFWSANLSYSSFARADLSGANLTNANLTCCDFREADLSDAILDGATLDGADFTNAILTGSGLSRVQDAQKRVWHLEWRPLASRKEQVPPIPALLRNHPPYAEFLPRPTVPSPEQEPLIAPPANWPYLPAQEGEGMPDPDWDGSPPQEYEMDEEEMEASEFRSLDGEYGDDEPYYGNEAEDEFLPEDDEDEEDPY